jgi:hypothetical protein
MGERVTISYRGAAYELGRGKHSYGIWAAGTPRAEPIERWPETPEGWNAAWSRFAAMERPGSIAAARPGPSLSISASAGLAAALLGIGVLCGIIGLFPGYVGGQSLASQPVQVVPHAIYLGAWTLSALLLLLGGAGRRAGALIGIGVSIVTFGLFFTDLGQVLAYGSRLMDAGLWFSLIGWVACAAGSAAACLVKPRTKTAPAPAGDAEPVEAAEHHEAATEHPEAATQPVDPQGKTEPTANTEPPAVTRPVPVPVPVNGTTATSGPGRFLGALGLPRGHEIGRAALLILAAIGVAIAFAPSWDSYLLQTAQGQSQTYIAGNAFSNPGWMIAGDLAVMIAFGLVVIAAALWRPLRLGAMLLIGAVIPMAAQAISALVQVGEATPPSQFGISSARASAAGLTITNGLTGTFWIYSILLVVLVVSCAWMLLTPPAVMAYAPAGPAAPATPPTPPGPAGWEVDDDDEDDPVWAADDEPDIIDSHDDKADDTDRKGADAWP